MLPVLCCACRHNKFDQIVVARVSISVESVSHQKFDTILSPQVNFACAVAESFASRSNRPLS